MGSTNSRIVISFVLALASCVAGAQPAGIHVAGTVLDPVGHPVPEARLKFEPASGVLLAPAARATRTLPTETDKDGNFALDLPASGAWSVQVEADGFAPITRKLAVSPNAASLTLRMEKVAATTEEVLVSAAVSRIDLDRPDPSETVMVREQLLDANPGRPGAPISIPGLPIETASGGIKAPQYFAPGVMADHGEPIAQYITVGGYLVTNNLSANAHGNGYSDPNIYVSGALAGVTTDGGAFNVLEGNHALNLAATYMPRQQMTNFVTLTGDDRDIDMTAGFAPKNPARREWVALEANYGNGLLKDMEHRQMYKLNAQRVFDVGRHELTLFGIASYGVSHEGNLVPIGFGQDLGDTLDPRQMDQTHTALAAADDRWKIGTKDDLAFSGFARTYNLALFSNFGEGLIRQSEFRTVEGASVGYVNKITQHFTLLAGTDYNREAPRRDDLDHYNFYNPAEASYYGPFVKIAGNNVTISDVASCVAGQGDLSKYVHYYLGWRHDEIWIDNQDLVAPQDSTYKLAGLDLPKATITFLPGQHAPLISFSFGKSFFTEDPREGLATGPTGKPAYVSAVERARSYQMVAMKTFHKTDLKLTLGSETQSNEYGKIDPDQGIQEPLGPGRIRFLAATLRQTVANGSLQVTFEQADARLVGVPISSITPEVPRLIGDVLGTYQKLPFHLQAKGEFEYVGRKVVGTSCDASQPLTGGTAYCLGVPNQEFRMALARPFLDGRMSAGLNMMIASGWTGQTTENFAAASVYGPGKVGLVNGVVPVNPVNEVVGVRIPSYISFNLTYRFGRKNGP